MHHITRCLNSKLVDICQRAIKLEELKAIVLQYIPEELQNHCYVTSFNNGCLNLTTHDAIWASQLRYALPNLRDKLRGEAGIYHLASIKITIGAKSPIIGTSKINKRQHNLTSIAVERLEACKKLLLNKSE